MKRENGGKEPERLGERAIRILVQSKCEKTYLLSRTYR